MDDNALINKNILDILNSYSDDRGRAHHISEFLSTVARDKIPEYLDIINNSKAKEV